MEIICATTAAYRYWRWLLPEARREIDRWALQAMAIRDPVVRGLAVGKIERERRNVESAAFFAVLAGRDWRRVLPAIVAFQVAYEFLDGLNEVDATMSAGRRLHGALLEAVGGDRCDHGGGSYLQALVDRCSALCGTPSAALVDAVVRVGEAQSLNHVGVGLERWARAQRSRLWWWETAAAGISSLDVLAMLASPAGLHARILRAYFEVRALSALLDAMVDLGTDPAANHNWVRHYRSRREMADRLSALTIGAQGALRSLPDPVVHRLLCAGLLAHNAVVLDDDLRAAIPPVPYLRTGLLFLRVTHRQQT